MAISVISLAALVSLSREGTVEDVRLAWGSAGPTVVTSPEVEDALRGKALEHGIPEKKPLFLQKRP